MNEWRKISLREVIEINPASVGSDFKAEWIEYIDISSVGEGAITESPKVIKLKEAPSRAKRLVSQNDTVISTVRPNRRSMFFAKEPKQNWVLSTGFAVLRPLSEKIEPRFLYASVFNREFTEYLISREKGAAYPAVLPEDIYEAEILLPPLPEQKSIARILSSLDDKIELNRRMNETLEAMARAIFKDWFVDFGPTRAKQEGRAAYLPEHLWSLFPEAIDLETGLPMGWEILTLGEMGKIITGKTPSTKFPEYFGGDIPFITPSDMEGTKGIHKTSRYLTRKGLSVVKSSLITAGSIAVSCIGSDMGKVVYVVKESVTNQQINSVILNEGYSNEYLYYDLIGRQAELQNLSRGGSAVPILNKTHFSQVKSVIPSPPLLHQFDVIAKSITEKNFANEMESRTLAEMRDRLLPKLMSGEIRVKDAEKLVEEVM